MTKADLIEEVSRVVEMTRKESEVIVEGGLPPTSSSRADDL